MHFLSSISRLRLSDDHGVEPPFSEEKERVVAGCDADDRRVALVDRHELLFRDRRNATAVFAIAQIWNGKNPVYRLQ